MGAWAGGLFENDTDLDIISDLSEETGVELNRQGENAQPAVGMSVRPGGGFLVGSSFGRSFDENKLLSIKETRAHLDVGNFKRVFDKYQGMETTEYMFGLSFPFAGGNYCCMLLAAAAMRVGATITEHQRSYLKSQYKRCGLMKEGIEQMGKALETYRSGKAYELIEPDRSEQQDELEARRVETQRTERVLLMNHVGERFFEEGQGTPDFLTLWDRQNKDKRCARCTKVGFMLAEGQKLKNCAKCKKTLYCSRECQKKDWKHHKKDCARLAGEAAE